MVNVTGRDDDRDYKFAGGTVPQPVTRSASTPSPGDSYLNRKEAPEGHSPSPMGNAGRDGGGGGLRDRMLVAAEEFQADLYRMDVALAVAKHCRRLETEGWEL